MGWISKRKENEDKYNTALLSDVENDEDEEGNLVENNGCGAISSSTNGALVGTTNGQNHILNGSDNGEPFESIPVVIYASRTHTQISQGIMNECHN